MKQRRHGLAGLKNLPRSGRPSWLTAQQCRQVLRQLKRGAQAFGYETERWTLGRIRQLIEHKYGVTYNAKCTTNCGDWDGVHSSQPSMPRSVTKN